MSKEVSGGQEKPTAPERWPESSGRGLDEAFSRPSEGGRVVRLLGQPLGDRMGEFKLFD